MCICEASSFYSLEEPSAMGSHPATFTNVCLFTCPAPENTQLGHPLVCGAQLESRRGKEKKKEKERKK